MPEGDTSEQAPAKPHHIKYHKGYSFRETDDFYKRDRKRGLGKDDRSWFSTRKGDNYQQLSKELTVLGHRADAEDMMETLHEIGYLRARSAFRDKRRQDFIAHTAYTTLDKAIDAYKNKEISERQFKDILYRTQRQLSDALHIPSQEELRKKKPGEMRLTDIIHKELAKQAAALLAFIFSVLSFDQARVTGMAVASISNGYDYYSLFGFLFLALALLLFLMRKQ